MIKTATSEETAGSAEETNTDGQPQQIIKARGNGKRLNLKTGDKGEFYEVTATGIVIRPGMDQTDWLKLAEHSIGDYELTRDTHLAAMFRVGDVLAYGERAYSEEYAQAIDSTRKAIRLSVKTLQNIQWICGSIRPAVRHDLLTVAHHGVVAKLTEDEQIHFLTMAEEEELSVSELKKRVKAAHPNPNKKDPSRKVVVDLEDEDGLLHAAEKLIEFFEVEENNPEQFSKERAAKWTPTVTRLFALFAPLEEVAREGSKEIAAFLEHPDNGPLKNWSPAKKKRWANSLDAISKGARRMGVVACGVKKAKQAETGEQAE